MSETRPRRDLAGMAGAALFIVIGGLALWHSSEFTPLGSVFPRTVAVTMILLSIAYLAVALLRPEDAPPQAAGSTWRRVALMAVFVAWSLLLEPLGFLTTSIAAFVAILVIANYDRWTPRMVVTYGVVGGLVLGGLYAIFRFVLQVPLPAGILL